MTSLKEEERENSQRPENACINAKAVSYFFFSGIEGKAPFFCRLLSCPSDDGRVMTVVLAGLFKHS